MNRHHSRLAVLSALAGLAAAGGAAACPTNCTSCCNLPTTHQIIVPGMQVTPPSVTVGSPTLGCDTCGGGGSGGGFGSINVTVNVQQTATATASGAASASASGLSNAAAANIITSGGGAGYWSGDGPSTSITTVNVVGAEAPPPPPPPPPVCVAQKAVFRVMAVQAVCLDDKATPHPASQTTPDRELGDGFSGEVFRCIAGSHMQFTVAPYAGGAASFDHGQTKVCQKGDALWRYPDGRLECKPQAPARDCNERSLLRRYGAGIKVVKAVAGQTCAAWSGQVAAVSAPPAVAPPPATIYADAPPPAPAFAGDGGVGRGW